MLWTAVLSAGPPVLAVVSVGLIMAIVQAATQVNDQAVSFGPKAVAAVVALIVAGPWMLSRISGFTVSLFDAMATLQMHP